LLGPSRFAFRLPKRLAIQQRPDRYQPETIMTSTRMTRSFSRLVALCAMALGTWGSSALAQTLLLSGPDGRPSTLAYSADGGWRMHAGWDAQARSDAARPVKAVAMQPAQQGDGPLSERPLTVFVDGPTGFTYIYLFDQGWKFVGRIADGQPPR
jgi:hypothetical protein